MKQGEIAAEEAAEARDKGAVSRARKAAERADEQFRKARRSLGRLRRVLDRGSEERREILAMLAELDTVQFKLLLDTALFMWDQTSFSQAEKFAARASYIDPVHPDLLELRDHLVNDRIRYRVSDVTNARGIVR